MITDPSLIVDGWRAEAQSLRNQLAATRAKSSRQRRELHRLNAQLRWFYSGIAASERVHSMASLRTAVAEKFGRPAVHAAEREYLERQQEQDK